MWVLAHTLAICLYWPPFFCTIPTYRVLPYSMILLMPIYLWLLRCVCILVHVRGVTMLCLHCIGAVSWRADSPCRAEEDQRPVVQLEVGSAAWAQDTGCLWDAQERRYILHELHIHIGKNVHAEIKPRKFLTFSRGSSAESSRSPGFMFSFYSQLCFFSGYTCGEFYSASFFLPYRIVPEMRAKNESFWRST